MSAQLLPPIVPSPFSKSFESLPYSAADSATSLHAAAAELSATSLHTILQRARQPSPASIFSIVSAPLPINDENASPSARTVEATSVCSRAASTTDLKTSIRSAAQTQPFKRRLVTSPLLSSSSDISKSLERKLCIETCRDQNDDVLQDAIRGLEHYQSSKGRSPDKEAPSLQLAVEASAICQMSSEAGTVLTPAISDESEVSHVVNPEPVSPPPFLTRDDISSEITPIPDQSPLGHQKRLSTNSSGLVHTVKTASFSNGSFSVLSRSLRFGRSSETGALFASHSRFSTDSERPPTSSSIDEAAIKRALKRRQILDELVVTEESYIADLKALVYLMSTLLASVTSISNKVRAAARQNVLDLLHLHEVVLERCHQAFFKAAARKWADTISHHKLSSPRQLRFRSLEPHIAARLARVHRRTRSSMDSNDFVRARARLNGAECVDVADVLSIFNSLMSSFFAYEQYCANHEIIAHDLQRHMPTLWSTYEAGMESLARSVVSVERREAENRKGLTVGDLLIKPIQRVCRYPLLMEELLRVTPVADCPSAHAEVEIMLQKFRDLVDTVNAATHSPDARLHIHRRWSLQARLVLDNNALLPEDFRSLGNVILCGVLHIAYQTRLRVDGAYAMCVLFGNHFLVAVPAGSSGKFEAIAILKLCDLKLESATDGKGLQSPSALHTWKLCFSVDGSLYEFLLSACSAVEEEQWSRGLRGELRSVKDPEADVPQLSSNLVLELKSTGVVYGHHGTLARRLSIQRAATVGNRASIYQVIVRNTHNPEELHEFRQPSTSFINRSQSHLTTNRVVVLAPKRTERARLETILSDVWTKDKLPYPGMIASRGGQIIRASAGSLVRKLSLASLHGPFSRRSASLTISSRKSYDTFSDSRRSREKVSTFEVKTDISGDKHTPKQKKPDDFRELDTMDTLISRMIGDHTMVPTPVAGYGIKRTGTLRKKPVQVTNLPVGPDDSAEAFYPEEVEKAVKEVTVEDALAGKKKRWSNPIGILRGRVGEGLRGLVYSSR